MDRALFLCAVLLFVSEVCYGRSANPPFVICAVGSTLWAGGQSGAGESGQGFAPEDLDAKICDHFLFLIKGFEFIHETQSGTVTARQKIRNAFIAKGVSLKDDPFGLQVMAFINLDHPHVMLPDSDDQIEGLVGHIVRFVKSHALNGLCVSSNDLADGKASHYLKLLKALRTPFSKEGLLLSPSLPPKHLSVYTDGELAEIMGLANYILVDSGYEWDASQHVTGLHAPIGALNSTVLWYESRGVPRQMMVPMVNLAGITAKLKRRDQTGLGAPTVGPGFEASNSFSGDGVIPASEMLQRLKSPNELWFVNRDIASNLPYAANRDGLWVSYEDPSSMRTKAKFIRESRMAGGLMMTVEMDDFRGAAGIGRYPLISAFAEELRSSKS